MSAGFFSGKLLDWLVLLALVALPLGLASAVGWQAGRAPLTVQLSQQATAYATEKQRLAEAAVTVLAAAQARGDALSTGLLNQQTHIDQLTTEARRAIPQVTSGRPCLGPAALRLLDSAPGLDVAGLPPAASGAAAESRRVALDSDIAGWAVDAGGQYAVCRARLDALIDWHVQTPTGASHD